MIEFRPVCLDKEERPFLLQMLGVRAFENASQSAKQSGLNRFQEGWGTSPEAEELMKKLETSMADPQAIADVILVNGEAAGLVWATREGEPYEEPYLQIRLVAVHFNYQRQGLGRLAVHHVEEQAATQGLGVIRSTASASRETVAMFHSSVGFEPLQTVYEKRVTRPE